MNSTPKPHIVSVYISPRWIFNHDLGQAAHFSYQIPSPVERTFLAPSEFSVLHGNAPIASLATRPANSFSPTLYSQVKTSVIRISRFSSLMTHLALAPIHCSGFRLTLFISGTMWFFQLRYRYACLFVFSCYIPFNNICI